MTPGHRPSQKPLPVRWILEGRTIDSDTPTRFLIDRDLGQIVERGDLSGDPDVVLGDQQRIMPGFLDIHVHCRDDPSGKETYKEDFTTASQAALHGGVVLVADMPNNPQAPIDDPSFAEKREVADDRGLIDIVLYAGVTPGGGPLSREVPYKCYFGPSIGSLNLTADDPVHQVLSPYKGKLVVFHAESLAILEASRDAATHEARRPAEAEAEAIRDIAELARSIPMHIHIAHLSSAAGLEEIRRARESGLTVTTEVTPHHLFFDMENRNQFEHGAWLQMNPPLRERADREALLEAFVSGEIECLATDHAPHSLEENQRGISGVPHLDTFGAFLTWLSAEGVSWSTIVERASTTPAHLFGRFFDGRLGDLNPGALASFAVIDAGAPWRVRHEDLCSRAAWSPFEGFQFPGSVAMTSVRGRLYQMQ